MPRSEPNPLLHGTLDALIEDPHLGCAPRLRHRALD